MENKKQAVPRMAKWLLLLTLSLGFVLAFIVTQSWWGSAREMMPAYALFWGIYLLGYYLCLWKRVKGKWVGWYLLVAVAMLFLHSAFYYETMLSLFNLLIIPLVPVSYTHLTLPTIYSV